MPAAVALLVDALCVTVFVILGRRNHDEGEAAAGVLRTAAPFLVALALGWALATWRRRPPTSLAFGLCVWLCTLVVGMVLRRTVFDKGTAGAFVVVATVFLGLFLVGWRLLATRVVPWGRRRAAD